MKPLHPDHAPDFARAQGIEANLLLSNEFATFIRATLKPGQRLFKPTVLSDLYFYVLEGCGVLEIGEERQPLCEGMLVQSPTRFPQSIQNNNDKSLKLLACFPSPGRRAYFDDSETERQNQ